MNDTSQHSITPIGYIQSCFPEKFGIPRQPLLAPSACATLRLLPPFNDVDAVAGLEQVSHLWISFIFHQHTDRGWKAKVRPPRLGGNEKLGVFATRSSFRPNGLGLSVVKLENIDVDNNEVVLCLSGVDLLDGTPVVDIKPYVPYADIVDTASNMIANQPPELVDVRLSDQAEEFCENYIDSADSESGHCKKVNLASLIVEVLQQDPRPAYQHTVSQRIYGMSLHDCNIQWQYCDDGLQAFIEVITITKS